MIGSKEMEPDVISKLHRSASWERPRRHELKVWPEFFEVILSGVKTFEIRQDDRAFLAGDFIKLREWIPETAVYTGRWITARISYVTHFEQREGYVVFSFKRGRVSLTRQSKESR